MRNYEYSILSHEKSRLLSYSHKWSVIRELRYDSLCLRHSRATICDQRESYSRMRASDEVGATYEKGKQSMLGEGSYGMPKGWLIRNYTRTAP